MENKESLLLTKEERDEVYDRGNFETVGEERIAFCEAQLAKLLAAGYLSPEEVEAKVKEAKRQESEKILGKVESKLKHIGTPLQSTKVEFTGFVAWLSEDDWQAIIAYNEAKFGKLYGEKEG